MRGYRKYGLRPWQGCAHGRPALRIRVYQQRIHRVPVPNEQCRHAMGHILTWLRNLFWRSSPGRTPICFRLACNCLKYSEPRLAISMPPLRPKLTAAGSFFRANMSLCYPNLREYNRAAQFQSILSRPYRKFAPFVRLFSTRLVRHRRKRLLATFTLNGDRIQPPQTRRCMDVLTMRAGPGGERLGNSFRS